MSKIAICLKEPAKNKHYLEPISVGEKFIVLGYPKMEPESFKKQYLKLLRLSTKEIRVERREIFKIV